MSLPARTGRLPRAAGLPFLADVDQLWRTWAWSEQAACYLWTQDLYGAVMQYTGAGHGFAGNVYPLLRGRASLAAGRREQLLARCVEALRVTARHEGDAARRLRLSAAAALP